jgi:hypothetical protein
MDISLGACEVTVLDNGKTKRLAGFYDRMTITQNNKVMVSISGSDEFGVRVFSAKSYKADKRNEHIIVDI